MNNIGKIESSVYIQSDNNAEMVHYCIKGLYYNPESCAYRKAIIFGRRGQ